MHQSGGIFAPLFRAWVIFPNATVAFAMSCSHGSRLAAGIAMAIGFGGHDRALAAGIGHQRNGGSHDHADHPSSGGFQRQVPDGAGMGDSPGDAPAGMDVFRVLDRLVHRAVHRDGARGAAGVQQSDSSGGDQALDVRP